VSGPQRRGSRPGAEEKEKGGRKAGAGGRKGVRLGRSVGQQAKWRREREKLLGRRGKEGWAFGPNERGEVFLFVFFSKSFFFS